MRLGMAESDSMFMLYTVYIVYTDDNSASSEKWIHDEHLEVLKETCRKIL